MTFIVFAVILGAAFCVAVVGYVAQSRRPQADRAAGSVGGGVAARLRLDARRRFALAIPAIGVVFVLLLIFSSLESIPSGRVGVVTSPGGKITGQITGNGYTMVAPWNSVQTVSYKQQSFTYKLDAFSSETQDVFIDATIQYRLDPQKIVSLYTNVGPNWFGIVIERRLQQFPKDETVKYSSVQIAPNREKIRAAIKVRLNTELQRFGIQVDDYLIDNIDFPQAFKEAITAKQVATQDALKSQQLVQKAKFEAESAVQKAQGAAQATLIQAEADAKKNRLIAESITPTLVEYTKAQALAKANTIYVPSQWTAFGSAPNTGTAGAAGR